MELRAALEKLGPLDAKLKYPIDRLLKAAEINATVAAAAAYDGGVPDPLSFRPNPDALLGKSGEDDDEDEGEGEASAPGGVYRPPRLAAVPYEPEGGADKKSKEEARARKNLEKLRRSEILQTLNEQFSDKPEVVAERGMSELERRQMEAEEERRRYEEERFVRLVTSKSDKKLRKAAEVCIIS